MSGEPAKPVRGWLSIYVVAFGLMVAAGMVLTLAARDFLTSIATLWVSTALSAAAVGASLLALWLPRRR